MEGTIFTYPEGYEEFKATVLKHIPEEQRDAYALNMLKLVCNT